MSNSIKIGVMVDKVCKLHFDQNKSVKLCADELGLSYLQCWRLIKKSGRNIKRSYGKAKQIRIARLLQSLGMPLREIAKLLNVTKTTIIQYIKSKCDNSSIVYIEVEILSNLTDLYDRKENLKAGERYYLYGETNGVYLLRKKGVGRVYFLKLHDLVNSFSCGKPVFQGLSSVIFCFLFLLQAS